MSATNNTLNVYVGGACNTTFNLAAFSPSLAHSTIHFRGAVTENLCRGPGCVIQEQSAVSGNSSSSTGDGLSDEYEDRCTRAGGTYSLESTRDADGSTYRIAYCAVSEPQQLDMVGQAMEGLERTSVWCSNVPARLGGAGRTSVVWAVMALPLLCMALQMV
jgi:hypothetical protein